MNNKISLSLIVAASENNVIGIANDMPWRLPDDLKFFKKTTLGFPIVMGKNTWLSIGQKALPGRLNVVLSSSMAQQAPENVALVHDTAELFRLLEEKQAERFFVIGGGQLYAQMLPLADEIFLTRVHTLIGNGEVFFPEIDKEQWQRVWSEYHPKDERHVYDFTFEKWERRELKR